MNGKYYGKREIRWHGREKERLKNIQKRKEKNESTCRNRNDGWRSACGGSSDVFSELLADASNYAFDRN